MKIKTMAWLEASDDISEARCPICRKVWITNEDGEESECMPCRHLRFVWGEYGVEYYGDWDREGFELAYRVGLARDSGEVCGDSDEIFDEAPAAATLKKLSVEGVDEAYLLRDEGLEDGSTIEHYFGVKR